MSAHKKTPFSTKKTRSIIVPRGTELKDVNTDTPSTYSKQPIRKWPGSGTESATIIIPNELAEIVDAWGDLPDHIRQTIKTLISSAIGLNNHEENK